ncbi:MAG: LPS export ABC transporter permease LptF [Gammaproteobacteria bacterium]|nr:LPS export ABC transporter permease LptF [Gammaproteobacteria bacterium]
MTVATAQSRSPFGHVAARYVARELTLVFLGVFALLLIIGLSARFIGFLQGAADGRFTAEALWLLLALRIPEFVQVTAPFALFLALLLTFGRLHAEREYAVLATAGASPGRFLRWLLSVVLPVAAAVAVFSLVVTPEARKLYANLSLEQLVDSELDALVPGAFHTHDSGRRVSYAQSVDRETNRLEGVFLAERQGPVEVTIWAESGRQHRHPVTRSRFLELRNGVRYEGRPGEAGYRVVEFERLGQRLEREAPIPLVDVRSFRFRDLDTDDPKQAAELHGRIAWPLMTVVAALAAFGMARPQPRAGRFARTVPGVALFVAYYLALVFAQDGVAEGVVPRLLGLWFVHAVMLVVAAWLILTGTRPAGRLWPSRR